MQMMTTHDMQTYNGDYKTQYNGPQHDEALGVGLAVANFARDVGGDYAASEDAKGKIYVAAQKILTDMWLDIDTLNYSPIKVESFSITPVSPSKNDAFIQITDNTFIAEKGVSISQVQFNMTYSREASNVYIFGDYMEMTEVSAGTSYFDHIDSSGEFNKTQSFTVEVYNTTETPKTTHTSSDQKTLIVKFLSSVYYGTSDGVVLENGHIDNARINELTTELREDHISSFEVYASPSQYIFYCVPKAFGEAKLSIDGFTGGFELFKEFDHTNSSGYTETYLLYRSVETGLGSCIISARSSVDPYDMPYVYYPSAMYPKNNMDFFLTTSHYIQATDKYRLDELLQKVLGVPTIDYIDTFIDSIGFTLARTSTYALTGISDGKESDDNFNDQIVDYTTGYNTFERTSSFKITDTKNTVGALNKLTKLYVIGASSQESHIESNTNINVYMEDDQFHMKKLYATDSEFDSVKTKTLSVTESANVQSMAVSDKITARIAEFDHINASDIYLGNSDEVAATEEYVNTQIDEYGISLEYLNGNNDPQENLPGWG